MAGLFKPSKPIIFIGAAGEMCRVVIKRFARVSIAPLVLADINTSPLESLIACLPSGLATAQKLDLNDSVALNDAITGAALVVNGAGPFERTAKPVLTACLKAKIPYLDFNDDVESTIAALALHEQAKKEGVPCYIGCGASPGMTSMMTVDAAGDLDTVDSLDICWLVGDSRPGTGKAVIEHLMRIADGPCLTWKNGKPTINESRVETVYAPMTGTSETLLREIAHPEPITLPRLIPKATRIRCLGGLDPAPFNGVSRGLAAAVRRRDLTIDEAVTFLLNMINNPPSSEGWNEYFGSIFERFRGGDITMKELFVLASNAGNSLRPWRYALWGIIEQVWSGECTATEVANFLISSVRGQIAPWRGGLLVRAVGSRHGRPTVAIRRTSKCGKDSFLLSNMASLTGTSCAAFMVMVLEGVENQGGVFCPEDWAQPKAFYKALESLGTPSDDIVESIIT